MQLSLTPDVLVLLGIGALVVIVGAVVLARGLRRRPDEAEPTAASDWTGEQVGAPAATPSTSGPVTVAEAVAVREAATAPLPMSVMKALAEESHLEAELPDAPDASVPVAEHAGGTPAARPRPTPVPSPRAKGDTPVDAASDSRPTETPAGRDVGWPHAVGSTIGSDQTASDQTASDPAPSPAAEAPSAASIVPAPRSDPAATAELPSGAPARPAGLNGSVVPDQPSAAARPADPPGDAPTTGTPAGAPGRHAGSSRPVAAAVAHALAARAAVTDPARGDARDRLLAVLLADPARAVGATVDLAECQEQLVTLTGAVRDGRARLARAMGRLSAAGLRPEQLGRLSGLSDGEVQEYLAEGLRARSADVPSRQSG